MDIRPNRLRWLVLLAAVVVPVAASSSAAGPAAISGTIVFSSDRGADGSRELQAVDAAGRHRTRLTAHSPQGAFAAWSPDGRRIAFTSIESVSSDEFNSNGIWTMNADGTGARPVLERRGSIYGVWSPGGKRLAAIVGNELWVVRSDGRQAHRLSPKSIAVDSGVAWSPDGRRLAVTECRGGRLGCGISVVRATGGRWARISRRPTPKEIDDEMDEVFEPAWSPDGTRIVFIRGLFDEGTTVPIVVAKSDGKGEHRVAYGDEPRWSPDGTKLAYVAAFGFTGSRGIRVVRADGTGQQSLGNVAGFELAPTWSRDGTTVLFATTRTPQFVFTNDRSRLRFFSSSLRSRAPHRLGRDDVRKLRGVVGDDRWSPRDGTFLTTGQVGALLRVEAVSVSGRRRPLLAPARDSAPRWSPDGSRLAFVRRDVGGTGLFVLGANRRAVRVAKDALDPAWAPDGRTLSFQRGDAIYLIDAQGGTARELVRGSGAAWSPNGTTILFGRGQAIWSIRTDGSAMSQVTDVFPFDPDCENGLPAANAPAWSRDGSRIAFFVTDSPTCGDLSLYVTKTDGSSPVVIDAGIDDDQGRTAPSWSPDGSRILLDYLGRVLLVAADGSVRKLIAVGETPSWSPDGSKIVFARHRGRGRTQAEVWVMNADGSGKLRVVTGALNLEPTWRPTAH